MFARLQRALSLAGAVALVEAFAGARGAFGARATLPAAALAAARGGGVPEPLVDAPYEELFVRRLSYADAPAPPAADGNLPFAGQARAASPLPAGGGAAVLAADGALYAVLADGNASALPPLPTRGEGEPGIGGGTSLPVLLQARGAVLVARGAAVLGLDSGGGAWSVVARLPDGASATCGASSGVEGAELLVGTEAHGLLRGVPSAAAPPLLAREPAVPYNAHVLRVAAGGGGAAFAATADRVYVRATVASKWRHEWVSYGDGAVCGGAFRGGAIESNVTAAVFDADGGALWLGGDRGLQLWDMQSYELQRYGRTEGLPQGNVTALAIDGDGALWVGTAAGLVRRARDGSWRYLEGQRWLLGDGVGALAALSTPYDEGEAKVIVTTLGGGLSVLRGEFWTLERKAAHYFGMISPRHDRYGYVGDVGLNTPGDLSSYFHKDSDNDGLWTSMYAASQAFRAAVTAEPEAKADLAKRLEALMFLFEASGAEGYPARSVLKIGDPCYTKGSSPYHNSTTKPGWLYKSDTSSDEIAGHMFLYPILLRIGSEVLGTNDAAGLKKLIDVLVGGIVANNYTLVDPYTGEATKWGVWTPETLDSKRFWSDARGLRALEIQAHLAAAEEATGDKKFREVFDALRHDHGYDWKMVNAKITSPCDDNHSDDEEAMLPVYTYGMALRALGREKTDTAFKAVLDRFCRILEPERSSLYLAICAVLRSEAPSAAIVENLRGWPLDLVNWKTDNSGRLDVWIQRAPNEDEETEEVPVAESTRLRWNANPYALVQGGGGNMEGDPGAFLLAYWLSRYHGLIGPPQGRAFVGKPLAT